MNYRQLPFDFSQSPCVPIRHNVNTGIHQGRQCNPSHACKNVPVIPFYNQTNSGVDTHRRNVSSPFYNSWASLQNSCSFQNYTTTSQCQSKLGKRKCVYPTKDDESSYKRHCVEEEITNQMTAFHISPNSYNHFSESIQNDKYMENVLTTECAREGDEITELPTLRVHPEINQQLQNLSPVLPSSIFAEIQRPCMELVLWKPISTRTEQTSDNQPDKKHVEVERSLSPESLSNSTETGDYSNITRMDMDM